MKRILNVYASELRSDDIIVMDDFLIANLCAFPYGTRVRVYEVDIDKSDMTVRLNIEGHVVFTDIHCQVMLDVTETFRKD